ncbi:MAG TPA: hypothetical protein VL633_08890 [Bacteroidota bacterium]|nr:hypothetical protein [Bacteroidota bacterium]
MTRKNIAMIAVVAVVAAALGIYIVNSFMTNRSEGSMDDNLARFAAEANKNLPVMVDKETRLDATEFGGNKRFIYSYTLVNYSKSDVDTSLFRKSMQPTLISNYKTNPQMQTLRDENVILHYQYKDKQGEFLVELVVSPAMF